MTDRKKSPVALAGADRVAVTKKRLKLVTQNDNPRQRWKALVPSHRIPVSDELLAILRSMNGGAHD